MWDRWKRGESLHQIAGSFDRYHSSVQRIFASTAGFRPPQRHRSRLALTLSEREEISRAVVAGHGVRVIALRLNRAPSTISRELRRNGGSDSYRAGHANQAAWDRAHRPKVCRLAQNRALARMVAEKLRLQWSPEQISGWLKHNYPDDPTFHVSHETIYRTLFIQARGALKKELMAHLRRGRTMRRSKHFTQKGDHRGVVDLVSIRERPAAAEDRAVPGHWEGDLVFGRGNSQIATLVDRNTRYVMLVKIAKKDTTTVIDALIDHAKKLPQQLYQSLTWDRGFEMADHKRFTMATVPSLLLRSAESLAARHQREHQRAAPTVFPQRHRSIGVFAS
jgi:IS30 family transposase